MKDIKQNNLAPGLCLAFTLLIAFGADAADTAPKASSSVVNELEKQSQ